MDTKPPSDVALSDLHKIADFAPPSAIPVSNRNLTQPSPSGYKDSFEVSTITAGDVGLPVSAGLSASTWLGLICSLQAMDPPHISSRLEPGQASDFPQKHQESSTSRVGRRAPDNQLNTGISARDKTATRVPQSDFPTEIVTQRTEPLLSIHVSPTKNDFPSYVADTEQDETPEPREDFLS